MKRLNHQQKEESTKTYFFKHCRMISEQWERTKPAQDAVLNRTTNNDSSCNSESGLSARIQSILESDATKEHSIEPQSPVYACIPCNVIFYKIDDVRSHRHKSFTNKYFCLKCLKEFSTKSGLVLHIEQHDISQIKKTGLSNVPSINASPMTHSNRLNIEYPLEDTITHICDICCDGFTSLRRLEEHKALHDTVTVKQEFSDIDDLGQTIDGQSENSGIQLETNIKIEQSCIDIKTENMDSPEYQEDYDKTENYSSSLTNNTNQYLKPNSQIDQVETSLPANSSLVGGQTSAETLNADGTQVVPWLAPILPECPPFFIYGNQIFIRINQINSGPENTQNCLEQADVSGSNTSIVNTDQVPPSRNRLSKPTSKRKSRSNKKRR